MKNKKIEKLETKTKFIVESETGLKYQEVEYKEPIIDKINEIIEAVNKLSEN